jgi:hypothetical protein
VVGFIGGSGRRRSVCPPGFPTPSLDDCDYNVVFTQIYCESKHSNDQLECFWVIGLKAEFFRDGLEDDWDFPLSSEFNYVLIKSFVSKRGNFSVVQDIQSRFDDLTMLDELIGQMDDIALGTRLGKRYHRVEY